jgi:DNA-binding LytR/AlgR family response regulator
MVNVAIVDDDQKDLKLLTDYIKKYGCEYGIDFSVKQFTSGELFLIEYKKGFDIVFLDIDMPNLDGMETAKKLREVDEKVAIVFETVLAHRAIDGYSVEAINYIVKPFSYADFVLKMSHIKNRLTLKQSNLITIHGAHTITNISLNEVYYIDILRHYLTYHTTHGNITARGTMSEVEEKLSSYNFIRISNSHIVNLMKIKSVRTNEIVINGATLSISRTYKKQFLDAFSKVVISNISGGVQET